MNDLHLGLPGPIPVKEGEAVSPIGSLLVDAGTIAPADLSHALKLQKRIDAPLGDIMVSEGLVKKKDVLGALARQAHTHNADLELAPPNPEMADRLPYWLCLKYGVVPWREDAQNLYVATSSPHNFNRLRIALGSKAMRLFPVIVDEYQVKAQQSRLYGTELAADAETRVAPHESCRVWENSAALRNRVMLAVLTFGLFFSLAAPAVFITTLAVFATATLLMTTGLKAVALLSHLFRDLPPVRPHANNLRRWLGRWRRRPPAPEILPNLALIPGARASAALRIASAAQGFAAAGLPTINDGNSFRMPRVSILVPLLREREIAEQLIDRLSRLTYPKSLLEVVLVLEASDTLTRETIARTALPDWMRVVEVPDTGTLTTKPRALNYAMNFCNGSIIGIWDAEDWPEPDQLEQVVARFHATTRDVACVQGVLDYYNSRSNWLTRCFTIEYAIWWRVFQPGIARLGLVVPLGGTTLFFRRDVLERLGGWDAHNVTEDADLGVRLARRGFKTELLPTVTREEATSRPWAWVRQRSRWLKGFLVTYCVHMRSPRELYRDLGFWRFLGLQTIFIAAFSQFALAPVLWSFWLAAFGVAHPVEDLLGAPFLAVCIGIFLMSELIGLALGVAAVWRPSHRHLLAWLPMMMFYFTLATLAAYKALWELVRAPFYWDKTQHGITIQTDPNPRRIK